MSDLNSELDGAKSNSKEILSTWEKIKTVVGDVATKAGGVGRGGGSSAGQGVSYAAPSGGGGGGGNPLTTNSPFGVNSPFTYSGQGQNPNFTGYTGANALKAIKTVGTVAAAAALDIAAFLPTTQETVNNNVIAERMRFYSASGKGNSFSQYGIMNEAMRQGTALGPTDVSEAINAGASYGLNTGLKNFNAGSGFAGILGGAALASNLAPGIGLTGGMGVMAGLNAPQNVNMLRMLGVNVRGQNGTTMNDLPQIIDQLYSLLTRNNPDVTTSDLATSLMSGNALDSLINQYFGNDQNIRTVIVSGLVQKVKSKGESLRTSGTKEALQRTGGSTMPIASSSMRNLAELQLIQGFTGVTNKSLIGTNNVIQAMYRGLGGAGLADNEGGRIVRGIQQLSTAVTTFGGTRGGAGAMVLSDLMSAGDAGVKTLGKLFKNTSKGVKAGLAGAGIIGALGAADILGGGELSGVLGQDSVNNVANLSGITTAQGSAQSTTGNQFTGAITVNVSVPPGADPYAYKSAIADIFS